MNGETEASANEAQQSSAATRQRSSIGFPYSDLASALGLALAIHRNVGHGQCDDAQLAAWTDQSPRSSGFRTQVYAARMFDLIRGEGGHHSLTPLGQEAVDPKRARAAKAKAFLQVPLYRAAFDKYKGGVIPPPAALERDFVSLGVAEKVKDRARQAFERSAQQAGYFEHGKDRLVAPGVMAGMDEPEEAAAEETGGSGGGGNNGPGGGATGNGVLDALLGALPKAGTDWPVDDRVSWLTMVAMAMNMAYGKAAAITVNRSSVSPPPSSQFRTGALATEPQP
jgi:hypothetical protein